MMRVSQIISGLGLVCLALLGAQTAMAQRATMADGLKAAVWRADEARIYAMVAPDLGALDDMLTADCLYVHSNGSSQTKTELLAALRSGAIKYAEIRYSEAPQIRLYGSETAVLTGPTQIEVRLPDGKTLKLSLLVTVVYVAKDGRWQLASYQSTHAAK